MARIAPVVFLVATGIGVWMRLGMVGVPTGLPFDHLLHAHSHALYFGWAGLIVLILAGVGRRWVWVALALVVAMTAAFLAQGYAPLSIAASTIVMVAWYWAVGSVWRRASPIMRWSLGYVVTASLGVVILAVLQVTGSGSAVERSLAIHSFLSTFAWSLVLGSIEVLRRRERIGTREARLSAHLLGVSAWLLFPLGVMGGPEYPGLGPISRVAAMVAVVSVVIIARSVWRSEGPVLRAAVAWLVLSVIGLAAVGIGGSPVLAATGRAGVVIYLHALLLGFVTTVLVWALAQGGRVQAPLGVHHVGVAVMLAGVALPWLSPGTSGPAIALVGAVVVWGAGLAWTRRLWRAT